MIKLWHRNTFISRPLEDIFHLFVQCWQVGIRKAGLLETLLKRGRLGITRELIPFFECDKIVKIEMSKVPPEHNVCASL